MRNRQQQFGEKGESLAVKQLKKEGYKILERNYRTRLGEIDIIAEDGEVITFIEVKARKSESYGTPQHAVTPIKQKKISMVALSYLKEKNQFGKRARFDVVTINPESSNKVSIIKNAFDLAYT
ncbi:MAG: YraN family protein [Desulfobacterales bacterium]